jgi:hypothetical protein
LEKEALVKQAIALLHQAGYRITPKGIVKTDGLFIIKVPKDENHFRYLFRKSRNTIGDYGGQWPEGTVIAQLDESSIKWEPIILTENQGADENFAQQPLNAPPSAPAQGTLPEADNVV